MRFVFPVLLVTALLGASVAFADDGAALYAKNCAKCHGADGKADTPTAKAMKVPALAGTSLTAAQVVEKLKASAKHKSAVSKLSDADLTAIANNLPK